MAPKSPPTAGVGASSSDESSGSEDEQQEQHPRKIAVEKPNNQRSGPPSSDNEDDLEDDESDENTVSGHKPPRDPNPSVKSISSDRKNSSSTPNSKSKKSAAALSRKKPQSDTPDPNATEMKKRKSFERIWSDDAEQKLLKGIIDFSGRHGNKPLISSNDMDELHESLKNSINGFEFTKSQLANKIRKLKDKFRSISAKSGGSPNFTNPIDHNVYELSKKIWGSHENDNGKTEAATPHSDNDEHIRPKKQRSNIALRNSACISEGTREVESAYPMIWEALTSTATRKLTRGEAMKLLSKIDSGKSAALEEKFRKYRKLELQNHLRWLELMKEVTKLSCEAIDKSN